MTAQLKEAAIAKGTLGRYSKNFKFWESFCNDIGFPVWIDELPRAKQGRMVGLIAGLCASEVHNKSRTGNKYQNIDGKMAAVEFAHKAVRNAKLDYRDPEFELIAQGYKRSNSQVERKQPVTTPMLLEMRKRLGPLNEQERLRWGSIVLAFFFLHRSSELWGSMSVDSLTGNSRTHCIKAHNVILRDRQGDQVSPRSTDVHSLEVLFESHKGGRTAQGVVVRHYRSEHQVLCKSVSRYERTGPQQEWPRVHPSPPHHGEGPSRRRSWRSSSRKWRKAWNYHPKTTLVIHYA
ncbi:hypothetical protein V7S43_008566 [Phytophthora oleae]|uniref:Uncharacterized protein n=1 Tax=Phytophthora oleae TaxID=2107226 RepID=A0ABD3FJ29_9STRA